ncbi:phosphatase PAP2 family protein [Nocardia otitidiscaviarum]|uniref:phosphatase PAP2 family protein n=1 Tax=Nocardia otitidiscaviarum TaxID=1823 RepID=UPI002B4B32D4|nr:phosphatase PAP2 family protein [Nocardia otitidiscaviarum]
MPSPSPSQQVSAPSTARPGPVGQRRVYLGIAVMLLLGAVFSGLTAVVMRAAGPTDVDTALHDWAVDFRSDGMTLAARVITTCGDTLTMALLATAVCVGFAWRRWWESAVLVGVAALGAAVLVAVGKRLVGRERPPLNGRLATESSLSYPSGHSLGSFVVIGVVVVALLPHVRGWARLALPALAVALVPAIGLSRVYLGVHWPTDVLAGWILGALWLTCCCTFGVGRRVVGRGSVGGDSPRPGQHAGGDPP